MKVLLVTRAYPHDPKKCTHGVYGRLQRIVRGIAKTGAEIKILYYIDDSHVKKLYQNIDLNSVISEYFGARIDVSFCTLDQDDPSIRNSLYRIIRGCFSFRHQSGYARINSNKHTQALEHELSLGVDLLFIHRLNCFPPILNLENIASLPRIFFDLDDIEHIAFARSLKQKPVWLKKRLLYLQLPALISAERTAVRMSERTFICSHHDKKTLERISGSNKPTVLPNTTKIPPLTIPSDKKILLFVGTFEYEPNVSAVNYFLQDIFPLLRNLVSDFEIVIVGNHPNRLNNFTNLPDGVVCTGYVDDIADAYYNARAVICPILSGGGTRVKLVEAASYGRAMISTSIGAEGLDFTNGKEILIGDTAEEFANHCANLLLSPGNAASIGHNAYLKAKELYDEASVINNLSSWIENKK